MKNNSLSTNFIIDYLQEVANIAREVLVKYMMVVLGLILFEMLGPGTNTKHQVLRRILCLKHLTKL